jgi:hypothetical protein
MNHYFTVVGTATPGNALVHEPCSTACSQRREGCTRVAHNTLQKTETLSAFALVR